MLKIVTAIDKLNIAIGKLAAWGIVFAIFFAVYNAVVRKVAIGLYSNKWVDAQWMMFSITFLFCAAWTLQRNDHIRIDILNSRFSHKTRIWIDIIGHALILIPFCAVMAYISWPWFIRAYEINEQGPNVGGLPYWWAKGFVPLAFVLLGLQGLSELFKRILVLRGEMEDPHQHAHSGVNAIDENATEMFHE